MNYISNLLSICISSPNPPRPSATFIPLVHWATMGSDNGLFPVQCQAIIWTNPGLLLIGLLARNSSEIWIKMKQFSYKKMHLKMSSTKWRPFCICLNILKRVTWGTSCWLAIVPHINSSFPRQNGHHWPFWQRTFSNVFSWMKKFDFRLNFHWSLFLRVQLTIAQHWFR